jgi:hypothetical protein
MTKTTIWKIADNNKMFRFGTYTRVIIVVIGVALIVSMTTINGIPKVAALDQIHSSRQVSVSVDKVWNTIINLSTDTTWNQVDSMKVIKKAGNTIEADTTVGPQNANAHEIITFHPKQSVITNVTQGPITGSRVVTLSPLSANKTNIDVLWNVDMSGIPFFAKGFAKDGFTKATEQSLNKLMQAVVGR